MESKKKEQLTIKREKRKEMEKRVLRGRVEIPNENNREGKEEFRRIHARA